MIDDEEVVLLFDDRMQKVTIKYDPKILVPVLNTNPGIQTINPSTKPFTQLSIMIA